MKRLIDSVVLLTFLIKQIITLLVQFMLTGNTTRFSETGTRHATRVPGNPGTREMLYRSYDKIGENGNENLSD